MDGTEENNTVEVVEERAEDRDHIQVNDPLADAFAEPGETPAGPEEGSEEPEMPSEVVEEEPKEEPAEEEIPKEEKQENWTYAAYKDEKAKRQELEQRLQALEHSAPPQKVEKKEFNWEDPNTNLDEIRHEFRQEVQTMKLDMSQAQAMRNHEDFVDKYQIFTGMVQENPAVMQTVLSDPDPAEKLYQIASQKVLADEVGADPQAYRSKIEAEIRADIEKEYQDKGKAYQDKVNKLPPAASDLSDKVPINRPPIDALQAAFPDDVAS